MSLYVFDGSTAKRSFSILKSASNEQSSVRSCIFFSSKRALTIRSQNEQSQLHFQDVYASVRKKCNYFLTNPMFRERNFCVAANDRKWGEKKKKRRKKSRKQASDVKQRDSPWSEWATVLLSLFHDGRFDEAERLQGGSRILETRTTVSLLVPRRLIVSDHVKLQTEQRLGNFNYDVRSVYDALTRYAINELRQCKIVERSIFFFLFCFKW